MRCSIPKDIYKKGKQREDQNKYAPEDFFSMPFSSCNTKKLWFITHLYVLYDRNYDAKAYFIGIAINLLLIVSCVTRKGLYELKGTLSSKGVNIGFTSVCLMLSVYGLLQYFSVIPSRHYAFPITGTYENPAGFVAVQASLFPFELVLSYQ